MRFTVSTIVIALLTSSIAVLAAPVEDTTQLEALTDLNEGSEFTSFESVDQEMDLKPPKVKAALKKAANDLVDVGKSAVRAIKKIGPAPDREPEGPTDYRG